MKRQQQERARQREADKATADAELRERAAEVRPRRAGGRRHPTGAVRARARGAQAREEAEKTFAARRSRPTSASSPSRLRDARRHPHATSVRAICSPSTGRDGRAAEPRCKSADTARQLDFFSRRGHLSEEARERPGAVSADADAPGGPPGRRHARARRRARPDPARCDCSRRSARGAPAPRAANGGRLRHRRARLAPRVGRPPSVRVGHAKLPAAQTVGVRAQLGVAAGIRGRQTREAERAEALGEDGKDAAEHVSGGVPVHRRGVAEAARTRRATSRPRERYARGFAGRSERRAIADPGPRESWRCTSSTRGAGARSRSFSCAATRRRRASAEGVGRLAKSER